MKTFKYFCSILIFMGFVFVNNSFAHSGTVPRLHVAYSVKSPANSLELKFTGTPHDEIPQPGHECLVITANTGVNTSIDGCLTPQVVNHKYYYLKSTAISSKGSKTTFEYQIHNNTGQSQCKVTVNLVEIIGSINLVKVTSDNCSVKIISSI